MVAIIRELIYASGTQIGVTAMGTIQSDRKTFFPMEEQFKIFPGILRVNPESIVKFFTSGCSFESGTAFYTLSS